MKEDACLALMALIEERLGIREKAEQTAEKSDDLYEMPIAIYPELERGTREHSAIH